MSTNMSSKFISQIKEFGINPSKVHRNLSVEKLVEVATQKNEGMITSTGSLSVKTGKYTGRSPDDRFIVFDDLTHDKIHWGKVNKRIATETFEKVSQKIRYSRIANFFTQCRQSPYLIILVVYLKGLYMSY